MSKLTKAVVAAIVVVVVAIVALPRVIAAIRDDEHLESDLPEVNPTDSETSAFGSTTTSREDTDLGESADGEWSAIAGDRSTYFVGYDIEETLRGIDITATGTTGAYSGVLVVSNDRVESLTLTVDLTTLKSDESRRDDSQRNEGLQTDTFPEATFNVSQPVQLPSAPAIGQEIQVDVAGELTLHGVTRSVTIAAKARWNGDTIDVSGEIPITLADYEISPPARDFVSVREEGKIVFVVQFERA